MTQEFAAFLILGAVGALIANVIYGAYRRWAAARDQKLDRLMFAYDRRRRAFNRDVGAMMRRRGLVKGPQK